MSERPCGHSLDKSGVRPRLVDHFVITNAPNNFYQQTREYQPLWPDQTRPVLEGCDA